MSIANEEGVLGVTASKVFLDFIGSPEEFSFAISSGIYDGGAPTMVPETQHCYSMYSESDAIYCYAVEGQISRIASDGETTMVAMEINGMSGINTGGGLALDDRYAYWIDDGPVGTIMKAPKTGGTATRIARDTSPIAIAVDANAVYWSDLGGNIMRLPK